MGAFRRFYEFMGALGRFDSETIYRFWAQHRPKYNRTIKRFWAQIFIESDELFPELLGAVRPKRRICCLLGTPTRT